MPGPLPHDVPDLMLAPVVLEIDKRLDELGRLELAELRERIALDSNAIEETRGDREVGLLNTLGYLTDLHGWELSCDPRGVRLRHGQHTCVLGVAPVINDYLAGAFRVDAPVAKE